REEIRQLVALRVVDRIAGHRHQLHRGARQRTGGDAVDGAHRRADGVRVQQLVRALHGQQLPESRIRSFTVDELEPGWGLGVSEVKVCQVGDACERFAPWCRIPGREL